jgi:hypothetical protein
VSCCFYKHMDTGFSNQKIDTIKVKISLCTYLYFYQLRWELILPPAYCF